MSVRRQAIIWVAAGLVLIGSLETDFSEIWIYISQLIFSHENEFENIGIFSWIPVFQFISQTP